MAALFPEWVPITDGIGYTGELNNLGYTGQWKAYYTAENLNRALQLVDPKERFAAALTGAATYPYKEQIEQSYLPLLTSQRMSIKPLDGFSPNVMAQGVSVDGYWGGQANATNVIQNAMYCQINVEWMLRPINAFGVNCCFINIQGNGEFIEMGTDRTTYTYQVTSNGTANGDDLPGRGGISVITANTPANFTANQYVPLINLAKGQSFVEPKDTVTIEYPWVDQDLVDLQKMRALRGKINLNDVLQWYAGTLLYEGSDVDTAVSPLGHMGYKITHHFTARNIDWNLIPVMPVGTPPNTANGDWNALAYGWATYKPPMMTSNTSNGPQPAGMYPNLPIDNKFNSWKNRLYQYTPYYSWTGTSMKYWAVSDLFYYGFDAGSAWYTPPVNPLPTP